MLISKWELKKGNILQILRLHHRVLCDELSGCGAEIGISLAMVPGRPGQFALDQASFDRGLRAAQQGLKHSNHFIVEVLRSPEHRADLGLLALSRAVHCSERCSS